MTGHIGRREFITLLGGAAAWPLAARAQRPAKLPTIGYLVSSTATATRQWTPAFVQRLRELGWTEGHTVAIEYRSAEGRTERFSEIADEFVRLKVDVIVTTGVLAVAAAKQATSVIPIVFPLAQDPIGSGLVANLARPGGNVTGLSLQQADLAGKRIELLREVVPGLRRLAVLGNVGNVASEIGDAQIAADKLGLEVVTSEIRRAQEIAPAFEAIQGRVDALYVCGDALTSTYQIRINTLALGLRLPTIFPNREYAETQVSCPMDQTFPTCSGAPPTPSTGYCGAQSRPTCRSSSQPNSILSSMSPPQRLLVSRYPSRSFCAPTR